MTLHLKSRGYPFRPRLLFSSFIVVGVGSPNCVLFQERTNHKSEEFAVSSGANQKYPPSYLGIPREELEQAYFLYASALRGVLMLWIPMSAPLEVPMLAVGTDPLDDEGYGMGTVPFGEA